MKGLLTLTAIGEAGTGLALVVYPLVVVRLLLGVEITVEADVIGRILGAALFAIGAACWLGRSDVPNPTQVGLLVGVLIYDIAAAVILASFGLFADQIGIALWPAVVVHMALAIWCLVGIRHGNWSNPRV
jgi:hypothetical protein